jgi:hypothetical protein
MRPALPAVCPAAPSPSAAPPLEHQLAAALATRSAADGVLVVLVDPENGGETGRIVIGRRLPVIDGDALLDLVLPSEATVCDIARIHEPSLRRLARHWKADRLLVAPCTFGHTLVALAVVPVGLGVSSRRLERSARALCERFAAAVTGSRLLAGATDSPANAGTVSVLAWM